MFWKYLRSFARAYSNPIRKLATASCRWQNMLSPSAVYSDVGSPSGEGGFRGAAEDSLGKVSIGRQQRKSRFGLERVVRTLQALIVTVGLTEGSDLVLTERDAV